MTTTSKKKPIEVPQACINDIMADKLGIGEIATKHGLAYNTVYWQRLKLGLGTVKATASADSQLLKIPGEELSLLGTQRDAELAKRWGVSRQAVHRLRRSKEIPVYAGPPSGRTDPL